MQKGRAPWVGSSCGMLNMRRDIQLTLRRTWRQHRFNSPAHRAEDFRPRSPSHLKRKAFDQAVQVSLQRRFFLLQLGLAVAQRGKLLFIRIELAGVVLDLL